MRFVLLVASLFLVSVFSIRRLEAINGKTLHCAGQANSDFSGAGGFQGYSNYLANDTRPLIFMVYLPANTPVNNVAPWFGALEKILSSYGPNQFIGVQLGLWFSGLDSQIASGKLDSNIKSLIAEIGKIQRPFWIRIGYEFNGEWNNYQPGDYQKAYQRITQFIRQDTTASKWIATVWDYSTDASAERLNYTEWYPGDSVVDWWGVNIFSGKSGPASELVTKFAQEGKSRGFPIMLGESTPRNIGATGGEPSWNKWYDPYFNKLIADPANGIKAFCYINWDWSTTRWPTWGDAEIEKNEYVGTHFQAVMKGAQYAHSSDKASVLSNLYMK